MSKESITVTITKQELWDIIAWAFDKADGTTFSSDNDDYADYYWCVTDEVFKRFIERSKK